MQKTYKNYFKNHYKYVFSDRDVVNYRNWFYSQWQIIRKFLGKKKYKSCLEIGSGIGGFYQFIDKCVNSYKGVELDAQAVRFSNKYWNCDDFYYKAFEKIKNEKFDLVVAFEVLEHLDNPNLATKKIYSLLNKNGLFIGTSPYPFSKSVQADKTHLSVLHPENWKRLFLRNGFKKVEVHAMSFLPYLWRINKNLNIRIPFYLPFPKMISTSLIVAWK